jgi:hypothetical protein
MLMHTLKRLVLVIVVFNLLVCITIYVGNKLIYSPLPFESVRWRSGDARQRARMEYDLRRSWVLVGKSQQEVLALLGPPDREKDSIWYYDIIFGDIIGDYFKLTFFGWTHWMRIEFGQSNGEVYSVVLLD